MNNKEIKLGQFYKRKNYVNYYSLVTKITPDKIWFFNLEVRKVFYFENNLFHMDYFLNNNKLIC